MLGILKRRRLKEQLLILAIGTMVAVFLLQFIYYNQISSLIYTKNNEYTSEIMTSIEANIVSKADAIKRVTFAISYNDKVQQYLIEEDPLKSYLLLQDITALLSKMKTIMPGIIDFVIMGTNGHNYNLGYEMQSRGSFSRIANDYLQVQRPSSKAPYMGMEKLSYGGNVANFLVAAAPIRGLNAGNSYGQVIGYYFMLMDGQAISPQIEELSQKTTGYLYILDSKNTIAASNDQPNVGFKLVDVLKKSNYIVSSKDIHQIDFKMVSYLPKNELFKGLNTVRISNIILLVVLMIILLVVYRVIAQTFVKPIITLFQFMNTQKLNQNALSNERVYLDGYVEMNVLASKLNQMLDEIEHLTTDLVDSNIRVYELQLLRKQAEIAFLNSQINPHFLYNTLECIQGIAASRNVLEISKMTSALSRIFRYSIKEKEEVTLREELQIVKHYLEIQQIRFEDRFDVTLDVKEALLESKVKKMILQPIVENAVFYGLELKVEKGHLLIRVYDNDDGDFVIVVKDDGAGIAPNVLTELQKLLARRGGGASDMYENVNIGVGLSNVNQRLKGFYGDPYGVCIESVEGEWTEVTLKLPGGGS